MKIKILFFLFMVTALIQPAYSANEFEVVNDLWVGKNTGLGTTAPLARLHIYGAGTGAGFALRIADTTPADRLAVLDNGNVGIGLTNPAAKLDVSGQVKISGGSPGASKVLISDANGLGSWGTAPGANGWTASGASVYVTTLTDNVGIVTTLPSGKLEIQSVGTGTSPNFSLRIADTAFVDRLVVVDNSNVGIGTTAPLALLQVGTSPWPGLIVTETGNVGIGTTNPIQQFHISSGGRDLVVDASAANVGIGLTAPTAKLDVDAGAVSGLAQAARFRNTLAAAVGAGADVRFGATKTGGSARTAGIGGIITNINITTPQGVLVLSTTNTMPKERMRIDERGYVGIAWNSSPAAPLHVRSLGTGAGFTLRIADSSATDRLVVLDNSNVGIGTTSPLGLLQAGASPTPALLVRAVGNIGIGTTNPKRNLEIIPSDSSSGFYLNIAGGKLILIASNGVCYACGPDNSDAWSCASLTCP